MTTELDSKLTALDKERPEFCDGARKSAEELDSERDRLKLKLDQINTRVKRAQAQLKTTAKRLAATSNTPASRSRVNLQERKIKLKETIHEARGEARETREQLSLIGQDLADVRQHFSHALHIDNAFDRIRKSIARRRKAEQSK